MFTGLVRERGRVRSSTPRDEGRRFTLEASPELVEELEVGASIAVSGVCLTVVERGGSELAVDLAPETLRRTTLGALEPGDAVNLEPPLRLGDPLGGHWVQGHVDGTVAVVGRRDLGDDRELAFDLPRAFARFVVEKGSVALDGVSLTVAGVGDDRFAVALIPHTLAVTTLSSLVPGERVNLELDVLAKYVVQATEAYR